MASKGGLGKGLGALLGGAAQSIDEPRAGEQPKEILIEEIRPNRYQPRHDFDEAALNELAESIKHYGVLQPVVVRALPKGGYELAVGERRLRAAKMAGLAVIPAVLREYSDRLMSEIALVENIQREDLNVIEEAKAYDRLMKEFNLTQEAISGQIGRSRSHVANILRMLKLAPKVQDYVANGVLTMGQAKPLLAIADPELQCETADTINSNDLSARQAEMLVKRILANQETNANNTSSDDNNRNNDNTENNNNNSAKTYMREAEERLTHFLGTQVKIMTGKKKKSIQIDFYDDDDLSRILEALTGENDETRLNSAVKTDNFTV